MNKKLFTPFKAKPGFEHITAIEDVFASETPVHALAFLDKSYLYKPMHTARVVGLSICDARKNTSVKTLELDAYAPRNGEEEAFLKFFLVKIINSLYGTSVKADSHEELSLLKEKASDAIKTKEIKAITVLLHHLGGILPDHYIRLSQILPEIHDTLPCSIVLFTPSPENVDITFNVIIDSIVGPRAIGSGIDVCFTQNKYKEVQETRIRDGHLVPKDLVFYHPINRAAKKEASMFAQYLFDKYGVITAKEVEKYGAFYNRFHEIDDCFIKELFTFSNNESMLIHAVTAYYKIALKRLGFYKVLNTLSDDCIVVHGIARLQKNYDNGHVELILSIPQWGASDDNAVHKIELGNIRIAPRNTSKSGRREYSDMTLWRPILRRFLEITGCHALGTIITNMTMDETFVMRFEQKVSNSLETHIMHTTAGKHTFGMHLEKRVLRMFGDEVNYYRKAVGATALSYTNFISENIQVFRRVERENPNMLRLLSYIQPDKLNDINLFSRESLSSITSQDMFLNLKTYRQLKKLPSYLMPVLQDILLWYSDGDNNSTMWEVFLEPPFRLASLGLSIPQKKEVFRAYGKIAFPIIRRSSIPTISSESLPDDATNKYINVVQYILKSALDRLVFLVGKYTQTEGKKIHTACYQREIIYFERDMHMIVDAWLSGDVDLTGVTKKQGWNFYLDRAVEWHQQQDLQDLVYSEDAVEDWEAPKGTDEWEVDGYVFSFIKNPQALHLEGIRMRHCVGSYIDDCMDGGYAVYHVKSKTGGEVSTLGIDIFDRGRVRYKIDQHYGVYNQIPSESAIDAGKKFAKLLNQKPAKN